MRTVIYFSLSLHGVILYFSLLPWLLRFGLVSVISISEMEVAVGIQFMTKVLCVWESILAGMFSEHWGQITNMQDGFDLKIQCSSCKGCEHAISAFCSYFSCSWYGLVLCLPAVHTPFCLTYLLYSFYTPFHSLCCEASYFSVHASI